jgi:hypothetical protein
VRFGRAVALVGLSNLKVGGKKGGDKGGGRVLPWQTVASPRRVGDRGHC